MGEVRWSARPCSRKKLGRSGRGGHLHRAPKVAELLTHGLTHEIARVLNKLGRRTGADKRWNQTRVATARKNNGLAGRRRREGDDEVLTLNGAARHARVSDTTIRRLVEAGVLRVEQAAPFAPWEIRRDDMEGGRVRAILERVRTTGKFELDEGTVDVQADLFRANSAT